MHAELQARFGMAVRTKRKSLGLSQEELAGRAGLHRTYVADVERGARNLSLSSIERLAQALEVPISLLFSQATNAGNEFPPGEVEIVLVESNPVDVDLILKAFDAANLTNPVQVVRDGAEALEFVFSKGRHARRKTPERPQIILLDLKLHQLRGLEVLKQLKADPRTKTIPVVVLSGSERKQELAESLRLGAETYLVKPVDFNRFAQIVPHLKLRWALLKLASEPGRA